MRQRVACEYSRHRYADISEDVTGHELVIAGQHFYGDARSRHCLDRSPGACFRRIQENGEAGKNKVALVGNRGGLMAHIDHAACYAQRAESLRTERVKRGLEGTTRLVVERPLLAVRALVSPGQPQEVLRRTLHD